MESIFVIDEYLKDLSEGERSAVQNLYDIKISRAELILPETFEKKAIGYLFGFDESKDSNAQLKKYLELIKHQKIVSIVNKWTRESALYNYLRALRPGMNLNASGDEIARYLKNTISGSREGCDFCDPERFTPEDRFGRLRGKYCITSANLAKFEKFHSLLIFKKHDPLDFNREELSDYIETAFKWFKMVREIAPEYRYLLITWNCLPRAGASQVHGHMQLIATDRISPKMELMIDAGRRYKAGFDNNYFDYLSRVHSLLGLSIIKQHVEVLFYLTPIKEREIFVISGEINGSFIEIFYKILRKYIEELGALSFNMSIYRIPLNELSIKNPKNIIYILRLVDRGNVLSKISDIASMELYGSPVITSDPVQIKKHLLDI